MLDILETVAALGNAESTWGGRFESEKPKKLTNMCLWFLLLLFLLFSDYQIVLLLIVSSCCFGLPWKRAG